MVGGSYIVIGMSKIQDYYDFIDKFQGDLKEEHIFAVILPWLSITTHKEEL